MSLARLEGHRFVGLRDTMMVYDREDPDQSQYLELRLGPENLVGLKLIQTFGPDTIEEAQNRGFRPAP